MTSNQGIARGAMGVGALAAGLVGSAMLSGVRAAVAANAERQDDTYALATIRKWEMALAAEKARSRKLAQDLAEARNTISELNEYLAEAHEERDYFRDRIRRLKGYEDEERG